MAPTTTLPIAEPPLQVDLSLEWLVTDGAGGYASSTPAACPTRRYHGLLVAPFAGTAKRHVFLARFDETLSALGGEPAALALARYGEVYAPRGDERLLAFEHAPDPRATYGVGAARLSRSIRMTPGTVLVRYELEADAPHTLTFAPLVPFREADALTVENDALNPEVRRFEGGIGCAPYEGLPALSFTTSSAATFDADPTWYRGLVFEACLARGYAGTEDEFSPGRFTIELTPGAAFVVAATIGAPVDDPGAAWDRAARPGLDSKDPLAVALDRGADDFLQRTPDGRLGVVAGFPWFVEWGRDTFLALPGLTLARGRVDLAREALTGVLPFLDRGLLPNIFGTNVADSHYGSADAALWFARAVLLFERAGGESRFVERELRPALVGIAEAYFEGTDLGLFVDEQGSLHAGTPTANPTWMDAQTSEGPVTPRHGIPVEIAALWCSLLAHLQASAPSKAEQRHWRAAKRAANESFLERLWIPELGRLADRWCDGVRDLAVRPNMVLAAALEFSPLERKQRKSIVATAERELVTPKGLRTLAVDDPGYIGRYEGDGDARDRAYHQGTVWPWLFGAFVEASLRAGHTSRKARARLLELVDGLAVELQRAGLGHVSEVFDGDEPRRPGGTIAQAWNTAEWLRARRMLAEGRA